MYLAWDTLKVTQPLDAWMFAMVRSTTQLQRATPPGVLNVLACAGVYRTSAVRPASALSMLKDWYEACMGHPEGHSALGWLLGRSSVLSGGDGALHSVHSMHIHIITTYRTVENTVAKPYHQRKLKA